VAGINSAPSINAANPNTAPQKTQRNPLLRGVRASTDGCGSLLLTKYIFSGEGLLLLDYTQKTPDNKKRRSSVSRKDNVLDASVSRCS